MTRYPGVAGDLAGGVDAIGLTGPQVRHDVALNGGGRQRTDSTYVLAAIRGRPGEPLIPRPPCPLLGLADQGGGQLQELLMRGHHAAIRIVRQRAAAQDLHDAQRELLGVTGQQLEILRPRPIDRTRFARERGVELLQLPFEFRKQGV